MGARPKNRAKLCAIFLWQKVTALKDKGSGLTDYGLDQKMRVMN